MVSLYNQVCAATSKNITKSYSTSFSLGIKFLHKRFHLPLYSIYGFVRVADEIVDTFHDFDKQKLLNEFRRDTIQAIDTGISTNPVLQSYQSVVNKYKIEWELTETFLNSMEMDLQLVDTDETNYEQYILGSAEVVGLMCLRVFLEGDEEMYQKLKPAAMKLGAAFQKVNFLRDLKADFEDLGRSYFPHVDLKQFTHETKLKIEQEITEDFKEAYEGITQLPKSSRFGVYVAYIYYTSLFKKIRSTEPSVLMNQRVRIPNERKYYLFVKSYFKHQLNLI